MWILIICVWMELSVWQQWTLFLELKADGTTNLVTYEISIVIKPTTILFYISEFLRKCFEILPSLLILSVWNSQGKSSSRLPSTNTNFKVTQTIVI